MKKLKRPFATHYYNSHGSLVRKGATSTDENAIRAVAGRCFTGQHYRAVIVDRATGVAVYNIKRARHGFRIGFGSGIDFKKYEEQMKKASTVK